MNCCEDNRVKHSPCPVCKVRNATTSSSAYSPFQGLVCGERCGFAAKAALENLYETPGYDKIRERIAKDKRLLRGLEFNAVRNAP